MSELMDWEEIMAVLIHPDLPKRELDNIWSRARESYLVDGFGAQESYSEAIRFVQSRGGETPRIVAYIEEEN